MKSLLVAAALAIPVLGSLACAGTLPPTIQAIECNQLCAHSLTMGDLQTAEDQCDLGLQYSPQYANLWVNKGIIAKERAQFDKAKELLHQGAAAQPGPGAGLQQPRHTST
jgi:tetratricopeptide (TPR) repeat protein